MDYFFIVATSFYNAPNYNYINPRTPGLIHIEEIVFPAGPIYIKRWNPNKGEAYENAKREPISSEMMWRMSRIWYYGLK